MHPNNLDADFDQLDLPDPLDPPEPGQDVVEEAEEMDSEFDLLPVTVNSILNELHRIENMFNGVARVAMAVADAACKIVQDHSNTYYDKQPYHTSALSGMAWVNELLTGHPDRIRCELGVRRHVFYVLLNLLHDSGCRNSKYIMLEEQLAIFLYTCVTGLSVRHVGERFQRSNDTISKYVIPQCWLVIIYLFSKVFQTYSQRIFLPPDLFIICPATQRGRSNTSRSPSKPQILPILC